MIELGILIAFFVGLFFVFQSLTKREGLFGWFVFWAFYVGLLIAGVVGWSVWFFLTSTRI